MRTRVEAATTVQASRLFRAPLRRMFELWTDPALLSRWWGPDDVTTHELVLDPRVGGELRWALSDSDGSRVTVKGEIFELVPNERIAFTWMPEGRDWPRESRVTVDFLELRGVDVRIVHQVLPDARAIARHREGWNAALKKLERLMIGTAGPQVPQDPKPRQTFTMQQRRPPSSLRDSSRGLR